MKTNFFSSFKAISGGLYLVLGLLLFIILTIIIAEPVTSIGFGGIAFANLAMFGYPKAGNNARIKAAGIYDTGTFATGTSEYNLFTNPALNVYTRNRVLPLSGMEVFLIDSIKVWLNLPIGAKFSVDLFALIRETFVQIFIDEREKIKIPLLECVNFCYGNFLGETPDAMLIPTEIFKRHRRLQKPIIINANSNVQVKFVTSAANATAFDRTNFKVYLDGIKYDKLTDYDIDFVKNNSLEELSYSIYDVQTLSALEETLECFADRNKAVTLFNKTLPMSDKENFQVEAIEIFGKSVVAGADIGNVLDEMQNFYLEVVVDDVQFYAGINLNMFTVAHGETTAVADTQPDTMTLYRLAFHKSVFVLPEPIIIPANSKASVKLRHGALTYLSNGILIDFRGTLTRRVA